MPSYLSPAVYVEEVSGGVKPIAGVGTSTGAFVGIAEKGITDKAVLVTNWSQFVKEFGSFSANGYLAYAVYGFFAEGGTSCYVVRVASDKAAVASSSKNPIKAKDGDGAVEAIKVTANSVGSYGDRSKGNWGNKIEIVIEDPSDKIADELKLTVKYDKQSVEEWDNLKIGDIEATINKSDNASAYVQAKVVTAGKRPLNGSYQLAGGDDGAVGAEFIGDADKKNGLHALDVVDDINIVAIPDKAGDRTVILDALNYCKNRKDCFFIADPPKDATPTMAKDFKNAERDYKGNAFNNSYGALYYPWVLIKDPLSKDNQPMPMPPSGVVAGTYAYTDSTRGVHKAPAGTSEGYLDSVLGLVTPVTKGEHDKLNPESINVIRSLSAGICIWGARTLSADPEWKYVNIRRLFLYLEESIDEGTQWVVFEPNAPALWGKVKRNITAFLTRVWRDGALFGTTPEQAFFVKVDEENNPETVRDVGQLIIEVGVAPVKPAEFVIIRISQKTQAKS